ncbi:phosphomannomutase/phosphoglucomutase [Pseudomonadaceae bacterium Sa2CUA2]|uniref:phosphomannomutase n=1 Tax=Serpens gallinarum TaxID=2763075 RepID=A0ABR8TIM9_9PSED|nr:phosphomannomutase/phosphoglucomutase [Serpens gallinarum]
MYVKRQNKNHKDARPASPASSQPMRHNSGWTPALLIGLGALLTAGLLLGYGLLEQRQQQQARLVQAWADSQASALQQGLNLLADDVRALAQQPEVIQALSTDDNALLQQAERSLATSAGVIDAVLSRQGEARPDRNRRVPVNFAAVDLQRRAENGLKPAPEAYQVDKRWLLYSAVAVGEDEQVLGSLLLVTDLQRLLRTLPVLPADVGQLRLTQQFGNAPAQLLAQRGGQEASHVPVTLTSGNPHWQLSFSPSGTLASLPAFHWLGFAALLAVAGLLLGLHWLRKQQQHRLHHDVRQLGQMLQALIEGKNIQAPRLYLAALSQLAQQLARLPHQAAPTKPAAVAPKAEANNQLVDPLFQPTEILDLDLHDIDPPVASQSAPSVPALPASIFRAYDIRGVVGDSLTADSAYWIGRAIGSASLAKGEPCVAVGRDGRLSGPLLAQPLIQGLVDCGCQVTDLGMVPTPVLYFATHVLPATSGVMLTGSHNPPDYNGFKIVIAGDTLANEQILALKTRIDTQDLAQGLGSVEQIDILPRYFAQIRDDIALAKPLKVVVDCGNGVGGVIAPQLIEALGCTVIPLYCEVDGHFPNHHPDPGKPDNLKDLIARVKAEKADLGLAFDGDADRVGVVTNTGTIVYPDRLLMLFAKDVVSRNPGADVIYDVKCTRRLAALVSAHGGRPVMWKTGHSLMKKKMKETGALLAGEMSGHIFFKERWFGFDDGIYAAARLLEILSLEQQAAEPLFAAFPDDVSTPEINIQVTEDSKFKIIAALQRDAQWGDAQLTTLDGLRIDYPHGWGLVRASNTTPVLVLRFEAETAGELARIQAVFREQLHKVVPRLALPF